MQTDTTQTETTQTILTEAATKCLQIGDLSAASALIALLKDGVPADQALTTPVGVPALVLPTPPRRNGGAKVDFASVKESLYEEVKRQILTTGKAIATQLQKQFQLNPYQIKRMLADLAAEGVVSVAGTPRTGKQVLKRLTADGVLVDAKEYDKVAQRSAKQGGEAVVKAAKRAVKRRRKAKSKK